MKKTCSSSNILHKPSRGSKIAQFHERLSLRPISASSLHPSVSKKKDNYPILFSSSSNADFSSSIITKSLPQKLNKTQLYEEALKLKREVNTLRSQIALARSDKRKKEVEIMQKEKVIDGVMGDIKASNSVNPISLDKLKDANSLSKIKKDYKELKSQYQKEKSTNETLKLQIQNARPNNVKYINDKLYNELSQLVNEYQIIEKINKEDTQALESMTSLTEVFAKNHLLIESKQKEMSLQTLKIKELKEESTRLASMHNINEEIIAKQKIKKNKIRLENEKMLSNKKIKEKVIKNKRTYEMEIAKLKESLEKVKSDVKSNDDMINKLSKDNEQIDIELNKPKEHVKKFNYKSIKIVMKDPKENEDTKEMLLKSLINESFTNRKKYSKLIEEYIEQLKSLGCDVSTLDNNENGNISERNIVDNTNNDKSKTNITKQKTTIDNNTNNDIHNEVPGDNNDIKDIVNNNENKEIIVNQVNSEKNEIISPPKQIIEMTNEELAEFSYVLIKNFEAKKITTDIAKEKITSTLNTTQSKEDFLSSFQNNIYSVLNVEDEDSKSKISRWLSSLLSTSSNDYNKCIEVFLSMFANIKLYTSDEELLLSKKVKKTLLPFEEKIKAKLSSASTKGFVSFLLLKKAMEEEKIVMKDDYVQFLFYKMKQFDEKGISLYDLKIQNLFDIMENTANDSKMNTESDIEISNEEYFQIITNFVIRLYTVIKDKNTTIRALLREHTQTVQAEGTNEKFDVIAIENFVNDMKAVGIEMKSELEVYCLFSRYKISDEYEVISVDLLEKEIQAYDQSKSGEMSNKIMENVEEVNESNVSA